MPGTPEYGLCPSAVGSREGGYSETGGGVQGLAGDRGTAARGGKDSTGRSKGVCFMHVLFAVFLCMFCEEQMEDESLRTRPTYVHSCLTWSCCVYVYTRIYSLAVCILLGLWILQSHTVMSTYVL